MACGRVTAISLRFNLDNEQHCRVKEALSNMDPNIFRLKNQLIIDAIDAYVNGKTVKPEARNEKEFLVEIRETTENAVMRVLGNLFREAPVMGWQEASAGTGEEMKDTKQEDSEKENGITNPGILDMMNSWYDD